MSSSDQKEQRERAEVVLLFYHYVDLSGQTQEICQHQKDVCSELSLYGRIRVTPEGLNGTLDGTHKNIAKYIQIMDAKFGANVIDWKLAAYPSTCDKRFNSARIQVKDEVVALRVDENSKQRMAEVGPGEHLSPDQFHQELEHPVDNLVLLDVRNFYETRIGRFEYLQHSSTCIDDATACHAVEELNNLSELTQTDHAATPAPTVVTAIDPKTRSFSDFRHYVDAHAPELTGKKILMYCTGGVRCETASAYLKCKIQEHGNAEVYQLFGGIHGYQEKYPNGFFKGKNFVYDPRVSVSAADSQLPVSSTPVEPLTDVSQVPSAVIGTCMLCTNPWDDYCSPYSRATENQTRCCYCRVLLLVCEDCKRKYATDGLVDNTFTNSFLKSLQCEMCAAGMDGNMYRGDDDDDDGGGRPIKRSSVEKALNRDVNNTESRPIVNKKEQKRQRSLLRRLSTETEANMSAH